MQKLKTYDLKLVNLVIGGRDIGGYGEDGGIEYESGADIGVPTVGAIGDAVFSRSNNNAGLITITVGEWTLGYKDLAELMQAQQRVQGAIPPLDYLMFDPLNGDKFKDQYAAFVQRPNPNKALQAGERVFQLFCPNIFSTDNSVWGTNV